MTLFHGNTTYRTVSASVHIWTQLISLAYQEKRNYKNGVNNHSLYTGRSVIKMPNQAASFTNTLNSSSETDSSYH